MSEISFPIKDITRRKVQTGLTILGLTICTSVSMFLAILGSNLGFEITIFPVRGLLTSGFTNVFSRFILVVGLFNILAGALITSFLVYLTMSERMRDVGVMKAIGCLSGSIFGYFITELSILVFISCTFGTMFGIGFYHIYINILNVLGFSFSRAISLWVVLLVFLILILASHIFGALPIIKGAKMKPVEAFSPIYSLGTTEVGRAVPSKLGPTFRVAYRSLVRRRSATFQAIICISVVLILTTITIAGGMIANQTTTNYVKRAIGRDIVIVGHPNLTRRYVNFLSQFSEAKEIGSIDYLYPKLLFSESLVSKLGNVSGVHEVDPRLFLEVSVLEIPGIVPDPVDPLRALIIGDNRSEDALILGVEPEVVVNEWLVKGRVLVKADQKSTIIGDSLALSMFSNPLKQSIKIFGEIFNVVGVCLDPLNNGKVVYVPIDALSKKLGEHRYNLLFLKIDASKRPQVLAEIENVLWEKNLELIELNKILDSQVNFLNYIWSFVMFLPLLLFVTALISLISYLTLSISSQQREFGIMRALGAKPISIMKIVFTHALIIVFISGAIGISVGLFVTFVFLIPEPAISQNTLISVVGCLIFAPCLLWLSSLYPAKKAVKKSIVSTIHSV